MAQGIFIQHRLTFAAALLMMGMGAAYFLWPAPPGVNSPPLPSPNGYDDFVKAGMILASIAGDYTKMTKEELRSHVTTNQEPLRLVRRGLSQDCRVPVDYTLEDLEAHVDSAARVKRVAHLLSAEGELAEKEGRYDLMVKSHLDQVLLGQASSKGGLVIDKLIGVAVEDVGLASLERIAQRMNGPSVLQAIQFLEAIDLSPDSPDEYIKRDRQWTKKAYGARAWGLWLQAAWHHKSLNPNQQNEQKITAKILRTDRRRRQLLLSLAARTYELEHSKLPATAAELVPGILRAIPKDPETSADLTLPESN